MVFKLLRQTKVAGAGTNLMYIDVPKLAKLQIIALNNATTGNLIAKVDMMTVNNDPNDAITDNITLLNEQQNTTYFITITYAMPLFLLDYRRVVVSYYACVANDILTMMVGYEG